MASLGKAILDLIVDTSKMETGLNNARNKVNEAMNKMKSLTGAAATALGTMVGNIMTNIAQSIGSTIINIAKNSMQGFLDYATQVSSVSRSLGVATEEASRLIQVADDVGISFESLAVAMKIAQKNGIDPSIDGLAKLSDQYLSLAPGVERTRFLLDTFGKSGAEMGKLLEKGSENILAMNDAVDENMILTEKAIESAENYRVATDSLKDSWDALTYQAAPAMLNAFNGIINHYRDIITSLKEYGYWYTLIHQFDLGDIAAKRELSDATLKAMQSNMDATGSYSAMADGMDEAKDASKELEQALKEQSEANKENLELTIKIADDQKQYAEQHKDAVESIAEAERKLNEAKEEYGTESQNQADAITKLTIAQHKLDAAIKEYGADSDQAASARMSLNDAMDATGEGDQRIAEAQKDWEEANSKLGELEASWHEKTQRMIYDMVIAKLSVDGLTEAEMKAAEALGIQMGVLTEADVKQAQYVREQSAALTEGILASEDVMREQDAIDKQRAATQSAIEAEKQQNIGNTTQAVQATGQAADGTTQAMQGTTGEAGLTTAAVQTTTDAVNGTTAAINEEINRQIAFTEQIWKSVEAQNALNASAGGSTGGSTDADTSSTGVSSRDSGGSGRAGSAYLIGRGAQPEMFIPNADGQFFPRVQSVFAELGKLSGKGFMGGFGDTMGKSLRHVRNGAGQSMNRATTYHTNVYNPTPEPASKSMDKTLRRLSWGVNSS